MASLQRWRLLMYSVERRASRMKPRIRSRPPEVILSSPSHLMDGALSLVISRIDKRLPGGNPGVWHVQHRIRQRARLLCL